MKVRSICAGRRGGEPSPHTTAERRHQLRIEPAPMREFCSHNKNCLMPWLAAQDARPPQVHAIAQRQERHSGTAAAGPIDMFRRRPPGATRLRESHRHARPTGLRPVGHPGDRRGRARPAVGAGRSAPRPLPGRGRHRRPARRRGKRRGDRLAADPRLVRPPRRPHRRPGAPGPRRSARARGRGRPRPRRRRGCARPTGCARCSASGIGGTPSAATCTSSKATSLPPPWRTRMPPAGPRTSPSATTWSVRPPAPGPPS